MSGGSSFSILIETENLAIVEHGVLRRCLESLARQSRIRDAERVVILDGGRAEAPDLETLLRDFPWASVARAERGTTYAGLKAFGVSRTTSSIVVFADSDVVYEDGWLEGLLSEFAKGPEVEVVCGETTTPIEGPKGLAYALTFNFPRFSGETASSPSPVYWANNVAMRREVLERAPIPDPAALYRSQSVAHASMLAEMRITIWRQPRSRGVHAIQSFTEAVPRYFHLGRDSGRITGFVKWDAGHGGRAAMVPDVPGGNPPRKMWGRLRQIARAEPRCLVHLPLALPFVALFGAAFLAGRATAAWSSPAAGPNAAARPK
jgi:hypothetical protein